jgi:chromosome partitioning protein
LHCGAAVPKEQEASHSRGGRVYAIANQEGKVGKTTTAINLGACLADLGQKVLVVDIDPKSRATTGFGVDSRKVGFSLYELLVNDNVTVAQVMKPEVCPNLSLLPAKVDLYAAEIELVDLEYRETRLRRALEAVERDFDFILIDCPSSLGLLTINGMAAADGVILPLECDFDALEGMQQLLNTVRLVRDRLNPQIILFGVVLTMFDLRTTLSTEVVRMISEHFPREKFNTIIARHMCFSEAKSFGKTILQHDPRSPGAQAYKQLAEEVIARNAALVGGSYV